MNELFFMQQNKNKEAVKKKEREEKTQRKNVNMAGALSMDRQILTDQHHAAQAEKAKERTERINLKDVHITETVETNARNSDFAREKTEKATVRTTKAKFKEVNMATAAYDHHILNEQHHAAQAEKAKERAQSDENAKFDMANALFGGGGGGSTSPQEDSDEEEPDERGSPSQHEEDSDEEETTDEWRIDRPLEK